MAYEFTNPVEYYDKFRVNLGLGTLYTGSFTLHKHAKVKRVIFNDPATIIFWDDNTKTVVKCQEGDTFDKEKGFVMAYLKKMLGNDNTFNKEINKWVGGEE